MSSADPFRAIAIVDDPRTADNHGQSFVANARDCDDSAMRSIIRSIFQMGILKMLPDREKGALSFAICRFIYSSRRRVMPAGMWNCDLCNLRF